ncbi:MAG: hypothetical protein WC873_04835, partial [Candidatus Gracilibacteria bacterium]
SAKTRKLLHAEYGTKCAISHCQKPAQTIHHTARFALSQAHDPHYLAPLCHEHHLIAHTIDRKFLSKNKASMSGNAGRTTCCSTGGKKSVKPKSAKPHKPFITHPATTLTGQLYRNSHWISFSRFLICGWKFFG